jgi:hypothetical protein
MEPLSALQFVPEWIGLPFVTGGITLAVWSAVRGVVRARRAAQDPQRALAIFEGFRISVVGLAVAGLAAAWVWQLSGLLGLSLIIGGEELLESTVAIAALRDGLRRVDEDRSARQHRG